MTLGRLLMYVGWTLACPGAGQGAIGRRASAMVWAVAGLAAAVAITWTIWAAVAAIAVRVASAAEAAMRLRRAEAEDKNWPLYASLVGVAGFVFFQFTTDRYEIPSDSMTPTIAVGDTVLVTTLAKGPAHGDVIVFAHPCDGITHIKRAVAVAGDTVEVRCGMLYVNGATSERAGDGAKDFPSLDGMVRSCAGRPALGKIVETPRTSECGPQRHLVVPAGTVFMLGDNRATSIDSRAWGVVPVENVKGRGLGVVWPLSHAHGFSKEPVMSNTQSADERLIASVRDAAAARIKPEAVESAVGMKATVNTSNGFPFDGLRRVDFQPDPEHPHETITLENAKVVVYWMRPIPVDDPHVVGLQFSQDGTSAVFFASIPPP